MPARRVFISYRRGDTTIYAGRLFDGLSAALGDDQVFMDLDAIEPGADFVEHIEREVGNCEILVALIGRGWVDVTDADGNRRLEDPQDFVRLELATGLSRDIRVIPVLVQGATMPRADQLPDDLKSLARRNALEIGDERWRQDFARLLEVVQKVCQGASVGKAIELSGVQNFVPPESGIDDDANGDADAPAGVELVFFEEKPKAGRELPVEDGMTIGRTDGDVLLADPQVSRRHAIVRVVDSRPVLEDLGSTNGTFVNEERIEGARDLEVGDVVRFGAIAWRLRPASAGTTVAPKPESRG
jgi:hypothetical protein